MLQRHEIYCRIPGVNTGELIECDGVLGIIERMRRASAGDRVLLSLGGICGWGRVLSTSPARILTDDDLVLADDLLEDIEVIGVLTHEMSYLVEDERPTI